MPPIADALRSGERFPFELLATHYEEVEEFWAWWWEQSDSCKLDRPYTIADDDPILKETIGKMFVDTEFHAEFFGDFLRLGLVQRWLPRGTTILRTDFREAIAARLAKRGHKSERKILVFVGGGYGVGKTTTLTMLADLGGLPLPRTALIGVDYCKLHLPEFEWLKMVADGRASQITQQESRAISDDLFERVLSDGASFAWDSSMSNRDETIQKINSARAAGYELWLIGVWTPVEIAIRRAMHRARETRRFAHPDHLPKSAKLFAHHFPEYSDLFDKVQLYFNGDVEQPLLIGNKDFIESELETFDESLIETFLAFGRET